MMMMIDFRRDKTNSRIFLYKNITEMGKKMNRKDNNGIYLLSNNVSIIALANEYVIVIT